METLLSLLLLILLFVNYKDDASLQKVKTKLEKLNPVVDQASKSSQGFQSI